jgi:CarD family transcriptional regulator
MQTSFNVGDKAVYPAYGVAEVVGLETREISGNKTTFYILKVLGTDTKLMVPTRNVATVGLREVIGQDDVKEVYSILKSKEIAVEGQTWNRRHREYMDKIKTGSVFEIAEVLRDLSLLKASKDLSFGERKMLDHARQLLVKELAIAKGTKEEKIEAELAKIFGLQPAAKA